MYKQSLQYQLVAKVMSGKEVASVAFKQRKQLFRDDSLITLLKLNRKAFGPEVEKLAAFGRSTLFDDFFDNMHRIFYPSIPKAPKCSITCGVTVAIMPPGNCCFLYLSFFLSALLYAAAPLTPADDGKMSLLHGWAREISRSTLFPMSESKHSMSDLLYVVV